MNILYGAYYTILRNIRDWKYLLLLIAAPLLTILITGVSTEHIENLKITEKVKVSYLSEDSGQIAKDFNFFIENKKITEAFDIETVESKEAGRETVVSGKTEAFIYLSKSLSSDFLSGKNINITVYSNKEISSVKPLIESFVNKINTNNAALAINEAFVMVNSFKSVGEIPISAIGVVPNGVDKWTYSNMLIFLFYGAILSGFSLINESRKHTLLRIHSMPISKITSISGRILGNLVTLFSCAVIMIVFTKYVFNSNWNGNLLIILITFFLYCIITICFGLVLAICTKRIGVTVLIIMCANVFLFAGSGGGWGQNAGVFPKLSLISPHFYVTQALTNNIFHGIPERVNTSIISLAIMALILLASSIFLGRRKLK